MATDFLPHGAPPSIERVEIGPHDMPALLVQPHVHAPASGLPAVLIQHGYGAEKADLLPLASQTALGDGPALLLIGEAMRIERQGWAMPAAQITGENHPTSATNSRTSATFQPFPFP